MEDKYTVVINGKPEGPYHLEELKTLNIRQDTFVRKPGMDDYKEAQDFPELLELFGFTFQRTAPQYFAAFDQRLLAWAIDYFIIAMCFAVMLLLVFIFLQDQSVMIGAMLVSAVLAPLAKMIYGTIGDASEKQGTMGKRLLNIRVTDLAGNRISFSVALLRNASKIISALPLCLGYLYSFLNKKQQCLHDLMANTLVVKERLI